MKDLSLISGSANVASNLASSVPQSPVGVLDAACLSYKSDELTVGSCANSSHNSPDTRGRPSKVEFKSWHVNFYPSHPSPISLVEWDFWCGFGSAPFVTKEEREREREREFWIKELR